MRIKLSGTAVMDCAAMSLDEIGDRLRGAGYAGCELWKNDDGWYANPCLLPGPVSFPGRGTTVPQDSPTAALVDLVHKVEAMVPEPREEARRVPGGFLEGGKG